MITTASNVSSTHHVRSQSLPKHPLHSYTPWREPMSQRQINAYFEHHVLPDLSTGLELAFADIPEFEREEAIQDCICQALMVYRLLRLYEINRTNLHIDETPRALATFASRRYLSGIRFAHSGSTSCQ